MMRRRAVLGGIAAGLATPALGNANWPHDRITIVTSLPAGSTVDVVSRIIGDHFTQIWGRPVIVDNRGGANGIIACEIVARARPDGLTLLGTSAMTHAANPALYDRLPYDPIRDFMAIGRFSRASPFALMVNRGLGTPTLRDFIARLKREPGRHNFGAGTVPARIASELFKQEAGVEIEHVGYRGNQQAFPDLLEGRISMMSVDVVGAKPLVERGTVDSLVQTDAPRHPSLPGIPTYEEAGLPGFRFTTWSGFYVPAATPPDIVARLGEGMQAALDDPDTRAKLDAAGALRGPRFTPAEFQDFTAREMEHWGRIIRQAGIRLQ
ncbi:Bug family tripartite tricarboxylate transporter substrate binding protein [Falsiroseomonas sp. CW058]|uniref:Bug family tripartite tricarboxylate transporter substrate binding protein n=1 Tax=Falsiroseomonas sp. CW058 TaxID=3388664 RepID=UPI003D31F00A